LDAARGICSLSVVLFHFLSWSGQGNFNSLGTYTVYAFFILSSTTLCMVYGNTFGTTIDRPALISYAGNRIARILPLLALVALAHAAYDLAHGAPWIDTVVRAIMTATGLFAFGAPGYLSNTPGAWSLGIEIAFYFLFPVLLVGFARWSWRMLAVLAGALLVVQLIHASVLPFDKSLAQAWVPYSTVLSFGFYFMAGFVIWKAPMGRRRSLLLGLGLVLATAAVSFVVPWTEGALVRFPAGFIFPLVLAGGIALIFHSDAHPKLIGTFEFLGVVSYSSYLLHPFVYLATVKVAARLRLPALADGVLFVAATVAVAYASYRFFEMPARNCIRRKA
jgi:peptidoglycan/LPS O-acetylase OafA/YrhL